MASVQETRMGSPGLPFTKFVLLETIVVMSVSKRSWGRYAFIQAPDFLPGRA
jgi:hypothetical protein